MKRHTHTHTQKIRRNRKKYDTNKTSQMGYKRWKCTNEQGLRSVKQRKYTQQIDKINNIYYLFPAKCFNLLAAIDFICFMIIINFICADAHSKKKKKWVSIYVHLFKRWSVQYEWHRLNDELSKNIIITH